MADAAVADVGTAHRKAAMKAVPVNAVNATTKHAPKAHVRSARSVRQPSFALKTGTKAAPRTAPKASRATRIRSEKAVVSAAASAANGPSASVLTVASVFRGTPPSRIWR